MEKKKKKKEITGRKPEKRLERKAISEKKEAGMEAGKYDISCSGGDGYGCRP